MTKSSLSPASSIPGNQDQSQEECKELEPESPIVQTKEEEIRIIETD